MARITNQMKMLEDRLDQVRRELEKLRAQEALLMDMLREACGEPKVKARAPRSNVKQTVLDLLEEVGAEGLNAIKAVDMAAKRGINLERGTVSSLLSRLKNEGLVDYDGTGYQLQKPKTDTGPNILPIQSFGRDHMR